MKISLINVFFENQNPCHIRKNILKFPYLNNRFQLGVSCQNIIYSVKIILCSLTYSQILLIPFMDDH
jgi:hypothetical protein